MFSPADPEVFLLLVAHPVGEAWGKFERQRAGVIIALLQHIHTGEHLVAACTHLFW